MDGWWCMLLLLGNGGVLGVAGSVAIVAGSISVGVLAGPVPQVSAHLLHPILGPVHFQIYIVSITTKLETKTNTPGRHTYFHLSSFSALAVAAYTVSASPALLPA